MISWGIGESVNLLEGRVSSPAVSILAACGSVWCGVLEYWCDIVGGGAGSIWSGRVCIGSTTASCVLKVFGEKFYVPFKNMFLIVKNIWFIRKELVMFDKLHIG